MLHVSLLHGSTDTLVPGLQAPVAPCQTAKAASAYPGAYHACEVAKNVAYLLSGKWTEATTKELLDLLKTTAAQPGVYGSGKSTNIYVYV